MLVTLKNLGKAVLRLILLFFGFTCVFSTVLRFLSEAPKANVSDATICKKWNKGQNVLRHTCYNILAT